MMQRVWAKLVIASLIILGDGVFASESTLRSDDSLKSQKIYHNAEANLRDQMNYIVSAQDPLLTAAEINIQKEFDLNTQRIGESDAIKCKRVLYLTGINMEMPYRNGADLSETEFLPWQAYIQKEDGVHEILNQATLMHKLVQASPVNLDAIDLEAALRDIDPGIN